MVNLSVVSKILFMGNRCKITKWKYFTINWCKITKSQSDIFSLKKKLIPYLILPIAPINKKQDKCHNRVLCDWDVYFNSGAMLNPHPVLQKYRTVSYEV